MVLIARFSRYSSDDSGIRYMSQSRPEKSVPNRGEFCPVIARKIRNGGESDIDISYCFTNDYVISENVHSRPSLH
jgi:hypothetical protein